MSANSFGNRFVVMTFGESHGPAMGVVIDGCPAGIYFDESILNQELARRKPGSSPLTSARKEEDQFEVLSGVYQGQTLGTPIAIVVYNKDARSEDYAQLKDNPRAGHADDLWQKKFGHYDYRGGGRASGRETVARVLAGAVAQMVIRDLGFHTKVQATAVRIGPIHLGLHESPYDSKAVIELLTQAKQEGKSYGGVIEVSISNAPTGLGQPVFHKLKSDLAMAYMSLGSVAGVEIGAGFNATHEEGSQWHSVHQQGYGGIRGGLSTGEKIVARIGFKPPSSVLNVAQKGRHDPCIVPRALPVVEAMTYLVLVDHILWSRTDRK